MKSRDELVAFVLKHIQAVANELENHCASQVDRQLARDNYDAMMKDMTDTVDELIKAGRLVVRGDAAP